MLTAAVTTPTFKRRRATCWSDRPRSPNLPFAQSFRPTERTVVPKWRHRSPTFNRVYSNLLCHEECATGQAPCASPPSGNDCTAIIRPSGPLLPARGPSGRPPGVRRGSGEGPGRGSSAMRTSVILGLTLIIGSILCTGTLLVHAVLDLATCFDLRNMINIL